MQKAIPFSKLRGLFLIISLLTIVGLGAGAYLLGGPSLFNFGIDFSPGFNLQVAFEDQDITISEVRASMETLSRSSSIQEQSRIDVNNENVNYFIIETKITSEDENLNQELENDIRSLLDTTFGEGSYAVESKNYVGPSQAANVSWQTGLLVFSALILIMLYITLRFKWYYALGAVAAIFHDLLILLGFLAVFRIEITTATVAALLTIIGYSLNDTIVIFDRIRENIKLFPNKNGILVSDLSITQSMGRTVITSVTTFLAVSAILFFTSGSIRDFALALTVGIIVGTYSSIFVASPIMLFLKGEKDEAPSPAPAK